MKQSVTEQLASIHVLILSLLFTINDVCMYVRIVELAMIIDRLYGGVCYAGIDTDPELKYPKGAGRVAFSNQQSYIAAISARFVQLQHADIDKSVCYSHFVRVRLCFIYDIISLYCFQEILGLERSYDDLKAAQYSPSRYTLNSTFPR